ncbi:alpha/beta fold hydrolase [Methanosarcina acetivorans]|uniref:alpha/beta fold hydrolase n=1 Tax=Methanosarcina acetivorans TaxID=2214 RepID=UPI000B32A97D|nr:alpha/beta hydrolase [Methanosarcina acetivorans]
MGLGNGYKFISVSRFGFLRSPIPEGASIKLQAAQYKALLDYLNIKNVIVFGASAGGPSATQFANDYPERCSVLLLLSAVSRAHIPGDREPFYVNIIHRVQQSDYIYWLISRFFQSQILSLMGIPPQIYRHFTPEQKVLAQEMLDIMHPMSPRYGGTKNDGEMLENYHITTDRLTAPALIIHAKDDSLVSYEHAEYAHKNIKQSKLILFDTGGHGMLPQMEKVRRELNEFLSAV